MSKMTQESVKTDVEVLVKKMLNTFDADQPHPLVVCLACQVIAATVGEQIGFDSSKLVSETTSPTKH